MPSVNKLCKQFRPRSGSINRFEANLFEKMVFVKEIHSLLHSSFSIELYKTSESGSYKIITIVHFICSLLTFKIHTLMIFTLI